MEGPGGELRREGVDGRGTSGLELVAAVLEHPAEGVGAGAVAYRRRPVTVSRARFLPIGGAKGKDVVDQRSVRGVEEGCGGVGPGLELRAQCLGHDSHLAVFPIGDQGNGRPDAVGLLGGWGGADGLPESFGLGTAHAAELCGLEVVLDGGPFDAVDSHGRRRVVGEDRGAGVDGIGGGSVVDCLLVSYAHGAVCAVDGAVEDFGRLHLIGLEGGVGCPQEHSVRLELVGL